MIRRSVRPAFCTAFGIVEYANGAMSTSPIASAVIINGAAAKWIGSTVYDTPTCLAMPGFTNRMGDNSEGTTAQARRILSGSAELAVAPDIITIVGSTNFSERANMRDPKCICSNSIPIACGRKDVARPRRCLPGKPENRDIEHGPLPGLAPKEITMVRMALLGFALIP